MSVAAALTCRSSIPWGNIELVSEEDPDSPNRKLRLLLEAFQQADLHKPKFIQKWNEIKTLHSNSSRWRLLWRTMTISRAGRMPRFARVLKKASLFCGCNVCEKAQNSLKKLTWKGQKKVSQAAHGNAQMMPWSGLWRSCRAGAQQTPVSLYLVTAHDAVKTNIGLNFLESKS